MKWLVVNELAFFFLSLVICSDSYFLILRGMIWVHESFTSKLFSARHQLPFNKSRDPVTQTGWSGSSLISVYVDIGWKFNCECTIRSTEPLLCNECDIRLSSCNHYIFCSNLFYLPFFSLAVDTIKIIQFYWVSTIIITWQDLTNTLLPLTWRCHVHSLIVIK